MTPVPSEPEPLVVVILGPTASGKTCLSLALAERFGGEIVNCDSVGMYGEFNIGTAKPSSEERARVPHHLLDVIDPSTHVTAGEYARMARQKLNEIKGLRHLPIVVGGTGLYLRALLEGLFSGPQRSEELRERLRARVQQRGPLHLHAVLRRLDPEVSKRIHPNDVPKMIRAIEVCLASRKKITEMWKEGRDRLRGFRVLRLGLDPDRDVLYTRINQRAQSMFEAGLMEETGRLSTLYPQSPLLNALGYKQALQHLRGELELAQALQAAQQAHRNYAKRQMTWFRREPEVTWLPGFGDEESTQELAVTKVQSALACS